MAGKGKMGRRRAMRNRRKSRGMSGRLSERLKSLWRDCCLRSEEWNEDLNDESGDEEWERRKKRDG